MITIIEDLDEIDRKIIYELTNGAQSHQAIADKIGVSRNTIYRRIKDLTEEGIIKQTMMAIPAYDNIGINFITIGLNTDMNRVDKLVDYLKEKEEVKIIWETYGQHNLIVILMCKKDEVGDNIKNLKEEIEKIDVKVKDFDVSTSISNLKFDISPPIKK